LNGSFVFLRVLTTKIDREIQIKKLLKGDKNRDRARECERGKD
jgi:hypothetical protein